MDKKKYFYAFLFLLFGWQLVMIQSNFNALHLSYEAFTQEVIPIRLLTYNIQGLPFSSKNIKELTSHFKEYDVILLQECFTDFYLKKKELLNTLHTKYKFNIIGETYPDFFSYKYLDSGLVIASKLKVYEHKFIPFKAGTSIDKYSNKGFMYIKIYKNHKPIYIYNTHLQASYTNDVYDSLPTKLEQLKQLRENACQKECVCIGGDFNMDISTEFIRDQVIDVFEAYDPHLPENATHWALYLDNIEHDTRCRKRLGYNPYVLDFFMTKQVDGKYKGIHSFAGLSDHCAVELTI